MEPFEVEVKVIVSAASTADALRRIEGALPRDAHVTGAYVRPLLEHHALPVQKS